MSGRKCRGAEALGRKCRGGSVAGRKCRAIGVPYYNGNDDYVSAQCFSGDMVVQTPTGMKAMRDLQVGDNVLAIFDQTVENNLLELQNHLCDIKTDLPPRKRHKFANIS